MKPYQTAYQIAQQYDLPATTDTSTSKGTSTSGSSTVFKPLFQAPEKTISTIQSEPSTLTRSVLVSEPRLTINREPSTVSNLSVSQPAPSLTINREPYTPNLRVSQGSPNLTINRDTSSTAESQDAESTGIAALIAAFGGGTQADPVDLDSDVAADPSAGMPDSGVADIDAGNVSVNTGVSDVSINRPSAPPPIPVTDGGDVVSQQTQKQESATPAETTNYLPWIAAGVAGLAVIGAVVYTMRQR